MDAKLFLSLEEVDIQDFDLDMMVKERVDILLKLVNEHTTSNNKERSDNLKRLILIAKNLLLERQNLDDYKLDDYLEYKYLFSDVLTDEIAHLINKHFNLEEIVLIELNELDKISNQERNIDTYHVRNTVLLYLKKEYKASLEAFKNIKEKSTSLSALKLMISKNII